MSGPHTIACDSDDCPCWNAGRDSIRLEYAERSTDLIEAAAALVELLNSAEDPDG